MLLGWGLTRGSCSSAWATMSCTCGAGSPTPLRCSRWKPRPGRRSTRNNWKGGLGYRQLMWHGRNQWHQSARAQQAAGQGSVMWARLWAMPGSGGARVALELWKMGLGCPEVGLLLFLLGLGALKVSCPGCRLQSCTSKGTSGSGLVVCTWRKVFLTLEYLIYVLHHGWLGLRGSLHRDHTCTL